MQRESKSHKAEIVGNLLYIEALGSWTLEMAEEANETVYALGEQLEAKPWGMLMILSRWNLATPEAGLEMKKGSTWAREHNLKRSAIVFDDVATKAKVLQSMLSDIHPDDFEIKAFDTEIAAFEWLAVEGYGDDVGG